MDLDNKTEQLPEQNEPIEATSSDASEAPQPQPTEPDAPHTDEAAIPVASSPELPPENILAGIVGAFLFALAGGILYFVLYQIGFLAAISGIVGVICAIKGYAIFGKRENVRSIVISCIIAVLVLVIAWYFCLSHDVFLAHKEWFAAGEIDFELSFFEAVSIAYVYLTDITVAGAYLLDLGLSLILGIVGAVPSIRASLKKVKEK